MLTMKTAQSLPFGSLKNFPHVFGDRRRPAQRQVRWEDLRRRQLCSCAELSFWERPGLVSPECSSTWMALNTGLFIAAAGPLPPGNTTLCEGPWSWGTPRKSAQVRPSLSVLLPSPVLFLLSFRFSDSTGVKMNPFNWEIFRKAI